MKEKVAIRLEGVLMEEADDVRFTMLREGAREFLTVLRDAGFSVVLLSAKKKRRHVKNWLQGYGLLPLVDGIQAVLPAEFKGLLIDPRAIRFRGHYDTVLAEIEECSRDE